MKTGTIRGPAQNKGSHHAVLALALGMFTSAADVAEGALRSWTGDSKVGAYWSYTANWKEGVAPVNGDEVVFPASASRLVNTNSIANLDLDSITFSGTGYTVRGNDIRLSKGITATSSGSLNRLELGMTLRGGQSIECSDKTSTLYVNGNLNLQSYTLTTDGAGAVRLGGVISGTGGLVKNGAGTHRLEGASANAYTGPTLVNSGTLMLAKSGGNAVPSGSLTVGDGQGNANATIVRELANYQIGSIPITLNADGWLDVGSYDDTVGAITFNGGRAGGTATGSLILGGTVTVHASAQAASFIGQLDLNSSIRTFNVQDGTAVDDLNISAVVVGGGFVKTGAGTMVLSASNSFDGQIVVNQGTLQAENDLALGSAVGGTTVNGTGELTLNSTYITSGEALTLDKPRGSGNALTTSGSVYWTGPVTLSDQVGISASGGLNFEGQIMGTGGLSLGGSGICRFNGSTPNTYTGDTFVNGGTLELNKTGGSAIPYGSLTIGNDVGPRDQVMVYVGVNDQIGNSVAVTINMDGRLALYDHTDTVGALTFNGGHAGTSTGLLRLNGNVTVNASKSEALLDGRVYLGAVTRQFNVADGLAAYDLRVAAVLSGSGLTKTGSGFMALLENNTYNGATTVDQGILYGERDSSFGSTASGTIVTGSGELHVFNADIPNEALTLDKPDSSGDALVTSGNTLWFGPITLADQVGIYVDGILDLAGVISGAGGLSLNGPGTLRMSGSSANTFSGDTRVNKGTLSLSKTPLDGALPGPGDLSVGDGVSAVDSIMVQWLRDSQVDEDVTIHVIPGGKIDLNDHIETVGKLVLEAGRVYTGTGTLTLADDVEAQSVAGVGRSEINGRLYLLSGTRTMTVLSVIGATWPGLLVTADVVGTGGIAKAGPGGLGLRGNNNYEGTTTVDDGDLLVLSDTALGNTSAGTIVQNGAYLRVAGIYATSIHVGDEALTLSGHLVAGGSGFSTSNSWAGPITLAADCFMDMATNVVLNLTGAVSGPGGFIKTQLGTLILSGASANTFAGDTIVNAGTLWLNKASSDAALPGPGSLIIGDGSGLDAVYEGASYQIGYIPVILNSSGYFDVGDYTDTVGDLWFHGGHASIGSGQLAVRGSILVFSNAVSQAVIDRHGTGQLALVGTVTCDLARTPFFPDLDVRVPIGGSGGFVKIGTGTLALREASTFSGRATITEGGVYLYDGDALGSTNGGTVVHHDATLALNSTLHVGLEPLTLNGLGRFGLGALQSLASSNSWAGPITLDSDSRITINNGGSLNLSGQISGAGGLIKDFSGTLILSGPDDNRYTGETQVHDGTLVLDKSGDGIGIPGDLSIGDDVGGPDADVVRLSRHGRIAVGRVAIANSGLLDLDGKTGVAGSLSGSGRVSVGAGILVVGEDNRSTTYAGSIQGTVALIKTGTGTLTLTGDSPSAPVARVDDGTLLVQGSLSTGVLVQPGGRLGGTGTAGVINSFGTVAPGTSPGRLNGGHTILYAGSKLNLELNGLTEGVDYDQLDLLGDVRLENATLEVQLACPVAIGDEFLILKNDGSDAIAGIFAGLPGGALLAASNATLRIDYDGGSGNDVVLTVTAVTPVEHLRITSIKAVDGVVELRWTGGAPSYVVEKKTSLTDDAWVPVTLPMSTTTINVSLDSPAGFFRIVGGQ